MYSLLLEREWREGVKVDLLLCCGDFQVSVREGRGSREADDCGSLEAVGAGLESTASSIDRFRHVLFFHPLPLCCSAARLCETQMTCSG